MSEYRLVLPKTAQGGFAESPQQDVGNAGSPNLNAPLTTKNAIGIGIAAMYGKKVATAGFNAVVGQLGNARLDEAIEITQRGIGYIALGATLGVGGVILGATAEAATIGINYAVEGHAINLENNRIIESRGVRRVKSGGGFYG